MADGSEVFQTYEKEYATLHEAVTSKLTADIPSAATPEQKKRLINQATRELEEADEIISQMEMELASLAAPIKGKLAPRVKSFKDDIKKAKKDLSKLNVSDRDQLLGTSNSGAHLVDMDNRGNEQRSKMMQGTERLQEGSRKLEEAKRMAMDTETIGIETLGNLNQQREQILRTKDRLTVADSFITKSQGVLRGMHDTMMANKWLTYGIIGALMLLILIIFDPARPSKMTVEVKSVVTHFAARDSFPKLNLKLKMRSVKASVDLSSLPGDPVDFVMTFHSQLFDSLKVDLYNGSVKLTRKHLGSGKTNFETMTDWHWGSYVLSVDLFDQKRKKDSEATSPTATVTLAISFTPLMLPDEQPENSPDLHLFLQRAMSGASTAPSTTNSDAESDMDEPCTPPPVPPLTVSRSGSPAKITLRSESPERMSAETDFVVQPSSATRARFIQPASYHQAFNSVISPNRPLIPREPGLTEIEEDSTAAKEAPTLRKRISLMNSIRSAASFPTLRKSKGAATETPDRVNTPESSSPRLSSTEEPRKSFRIHKPRILNEDTHLNISEVKDLSRMLLQNNFGLPLPRIVKVLNYLYKFENGLPIPRTGKFEKDEKVLELATRFMDHSLVVYGVFFSAFSNGSLSVKDALRLKADEKTAVEYLGLQPENMLFWDYTKRTISTSRYYIAHDTKVNGIVISVQGTMSASQMMTDINADYFPFQNGSVHKGMLRAAQLIVDTHLEQLLAWVKELGVKAVYCTGHSLGAGTSALVTLLLEEKRELFVAAGGPDFIIHGHCFATPGVATRPLAEKCGDLVDNYVLENDTVPRLSVGTILAFKYVDLMLEASEIMDDKSLSEDEAFKLLQTKRDEIMLRYDDKVGMLPGRIHFLYKTIRKIPRRHQTRKGIERAGLFREATETVPLPVTEKPEIPHYVMEVGGRENLAYLAPRRHLLNHHMPWQYIKSLRGALEWLKKNEDA
ncbi:hypothetical protein HDU98_004569 [Podochytrium sp. JEL0797]|nr:hypothetical protein HDU98_004569 [Podochytrium sp. JEL0797]